MEMESSEGKQTNEKSRVADRLCKYTGIETKRWRK